MRQSCIIRILLPFRIYSPRWRAFSSIPEGIKNATPLETDSDRSHPFKKELTKENCLAYLAENIVYNTKGVIVTCKPYGLGIDQPRRKVKNFIPHSAPGEDVYFSDILPELAQKLEYESLELALTADKFQSGVVILSGNKKAKNHLRTRIIKARLGEFLMYNYLVVTVGHPRLPAFDNKLALKEVFSENGSEKRVELVDEWSVNDVKKDRVDTVRTKHEVLECAELASLTKVQLSRVLNYCLRRYMSTWCMSPILGDALFGSRVTNVLDYPVLLDVWNPVCNYPKKLPDEVLSALKLNPDDSPIVPIHAHLHSVTIPQKKQNVDLVVTVPPPEYFRWSCEQLNIPLNSHISADWDGNGGGVEFKSRAKDVQ